MNTSDCDRAVEHQFDSFCKKVLQHDAADHIRGIAKIRQHEVPFAELSKEDGLRLITYDSYPCERFVFVFSGLELTISNELVAAAFSSLKPIDQGILILDCVLGLSDRKIGRVVGLSRSYVQFRKANALRKLKEFLERESRKELP